MGDKNETIGRIAQSFLNKSISVHIKLRNDRFYNGMLSYVGAEYLELIDRKIGYVIIFFSEISVIEPYMNKEVDNGENRRT